MLDNWYQNMIIDSIKQSSGATLPVIIKDLIESEALDRNRMNKLWEEYKGNVPIKTTTSDSLRPENKIANDFRGVIVDQICGYMFGIPVKYVLDNYTDKEQELLKYFLKKNYYDKLDSELETYIATCGKGFRLLYYTDKSDFEGNTIVDIVMKNIKPFEAVVITDSTIDEPEYGMIYYKIEIVEGGTKKERYKVEWYDNKNVYYFIETEGGNFYPDNTYGEYSQPHGFDFVPLVKFANNTLEMGDFEKVRTNIDSYDKTISFAINDLESFANAYLLFYGVEPTTEILTAAKKSGAFYVPKDNDADSQNKVEFLTKDIRVENITETVDLLSQDIYKFAAAIDMSDESFSGAAQTGESRKWKLLPLEWRAKAKERLFAESLQRMFMIIFSFWKTYKGVTIDPTDINFVFTRSLPVDMTVAEIISLKGAGLLSTETALHNISSVKEVQEEIEKINAEKGIISQ